MAETILVVGSASIDQQSVIWQLLKADYQVRYAASNSIAIGIISAEMPSAVLLSQQSDKAQEMCFLIRRVARRICGPRFERVLEQGFLQPSTVKNRAAA
jgi:hypothetical protein